MLYQTPILDRRAHELMWHRGGFLVVPPGHPWLAEDRSPSVARSARARLGYAYCRRTARTLDLAPWVSRWVAVDADGRVRSDAASLTDLLAAIAAADLSDVEEIRAPAPDDPVVYGLGGTTSEVSLFDLRLELRPPRGLSGAEPVSWRGIVAVLDPWPHQGTRVTLGRSGFLDTFTVTLGPEGRRDRGGSSRFPLGSGLADRPHHGLDAGVV